MISFLSYPIFLSAVKTSVLLAAMAATIVAGLTFVMAWIAQRSLPRYGFILDCARLCADCDPGRDRGRRHPGGLSHAADPDLQHDLDPPGRLRHPVSPYGMRFASSGITRSIASSRRWRRCRALGSGRSSPGSCWPLLAPVLLAGWIYVFVLAVREARRFDLPGRSGTHVLAPSALPCGRGGSYGAVAALASIQIIPLAIIVAGLRAVELRIQRLCASVGLVRRRRRDDAMTVIIPASG